MHRTILMNQSDWFDRLFIYFADIDCFYHPYQWNIVRFPEYSCIWICATMRAMFQCTKVMIDWRIYSKKKMLPILDFFLLSLRPELTVSGRSWVKTVDTQISIVLDSTFSYHFIKFHFHHFNWPHMYIFLLIYLLARHTFLFIYYIPYWNLSGHPLHRR